jgi:hypothetical protein
MGYGNLSIGQGGLTQSNKQEEIIHGEETGLRVLLDIIFEDLNEVLFENFPEASELFRLTYTGVGDDTRDISIQRGIEELQTTATLNSLWSDSEKLDTVPLGGDVPLAPSFNQFVISKIFYGEFREFFLKEEGASKKPEYNFIIDPTLNAAYQSLKVTPIQAQQEQAQMQMVQQELSLNATQQQLSAPQQQPEQQEMPFQQPEQANNTEGQSPEKLEQSMSQTLRDAYEERQKLTKSATYYFKSWLDSQ